MLVGVSGVVMRAVSLMECCLGEVNGSMKKVVVVVEMVVEMVESMVVILMVILVQLIV